MAGVMLEQLAANEGIDLAVVTAGTHAVEGQPISARVRLAMASLGELELTGVNRHRSHQLTSADCASADLIVAMEADHVAYVRRNHLDAASRTATVRRLVTELPTEVGDVRERIGALGLDDVSLVDEVDVLDPAGGEQPTYDACAAELWELCQALAVVLG
jgi:protein-tyrosine-phosphatase